MKEVFNLQENHGGLLFLQISTSPKQHFPNLASYNRQFQSILDLPPFFL